jgi:RNA polymerase sigma-70 factor (ECF subfamily)
MSEQPHSTSDEVLTERAKAGDRIAFEHLCDRVLPVLYSRLRAQLPREAVDDVAQEVCIAVMRGIGRFRARSSFRTWVAAIARHKVADYYRGRGRRPVTTPLDPERSDPAAGDEWQERALVRLALRRLPDHYQEVLLLRLAEGLPFDQVAGVLGTSLEAAKSRYRRAVAAIAKELSEPGE